ncbi:MAG: RNA methyltransferase [Bacteroidota bacterium]
MAFVIRMMNSTFAPDSFVIMRKLAMPELNRLSVSEFKLAQKLPVLIVLDNIRSQNNIGSVFRTADAFRIEAVYLCGITATPPHREIHKTALGATESVDWQYFPTTVDAARELLKKGYTLLAVEQAEGSISLPDFIPATGEKFAIIFGNEVNGVDDEVMSLVSGCIEIPQFGTKHSINVSVAVGIVAWDLYIKMRPYGLPSS